MGDLGIKAKIRLELGMAGINFNNLNPGGSGTKDRIQARAESMMSKHGISVEELKEGTIYKHLENGKNMFGEDIKDGDVVDIDEILKMYKKNNKVGRDDDAAFAAYQKVWKATHEDPFDDKGNVTKAAYDRLLQYEKRMNHYTNLMIMVNKKKKKEEEKQMYGDTSGLGPMGPMKKKKKRDNEEMYGDTGPAGFMKKKHDDTSGLGPGITDSKMKKEEDVPDVHLHDDAAFSEEQQDLWF